MIGTLLAFGLGLALIALGGYAVARPDAASGQYGLPVADAYALGYVRATAVRDGILGLAILAALALGQRPALIATIAFTGLAAVGDFAVVSTLRGRDALLSLTVHAVGIAGVLVTVALLVAGF